MKASARERHICKVETKISDSCQQLSKLELITSMQ